MQRTDNSLQERHESGKELHHHAKHRSDGESGRQQKRQTDHLCSLCTTTCRQGFTETHDHISSRLVYIHKDKWS